MKFRVGDKVRFIGSKSCIGALEERIPVGTVGTVTEGGGQVWPYAVQFDNGQNDILSEDELELVVTE